MPNSVASREYLLFLLSSSAENLARLESILDRRRLTAASPEYSAIISAMTALCREYRSDYLAQRQTINRLLDGNPISAVHESALKTLLRNCINTFLTLHELLLFFPGETIRQELRFFLTSLLGSSYDPQNLSVILTSVFNAFEYPLDLPIRSLEVFAMKVPDPNKLEFGHAMELAIVDRDNPLSWAVLAHEFGHYLDQRDKQHPISSPVAEAFLQAESVQPDFKDVFRRLAAEILADLTSFYILGPVSILPIISMELNLGMITDAPFPFDNAHPFTTTRVKMIQELAEQAGLSLDLFASYVEALKEDERVKFNNLAPDEKQRRTDIDTGVGYFLSKTREPLLETVKGLGLRRFDRDNLERARRLKISLDAGLPIPALRDKTDEEIATAIGSLTPDSSTADARAAFASLREKPAEVSEVVCAGWIARCERRVELLRNAFSNSDPESVFGYLREEVEDQDNLLMKSIEVISVMRSPDLDPVRP